MNNNVLISLSLYVNEEQMKGKGEDSAMRITDTPNAALIAIMDGCGGAGAQIYQKAGNTSGARLSAEHVGIALRRWFREKQYGFFGTDNKSAGLLAEEMKTAINEELTRMQELLGGENSGVQSRLARKFPCTLAAILTEVVDNNVIRCMSFWAGDARTFIFRASGLQQTSRDDIRGHGDPFEALMNDGRLNNLVSISADYEIHARETVVTEPGIILTASDGCFSYFKSPMEFEWTLLDTMVNAASPKEWEDTLRRKLGAYAADDYTMNLAILGFYSWNAVRQAYRPRWIEFQEKYGEPLTRILADENYQEHQRLWLQYKKDYMIEEKDG